MSSSSSDEVITEDCPLLDTRNCNNTKINKSETQNQMKTQNTAKSVTKFDWNTNQEESTITLTVPLPSSTLSSTVVAAAATTTTTTNYVITIHHTNNNNNHNNNNNNNNDNINNSKKKTFNTTNSSAVTTILKIFITKYLTWLWPKLRRKRIQVFIAIAVLYIFYANAIVTIDENESQNIIPVVHYSHVPGIKGYLVWSEHCKMPNIDPYLPEMMKHFKREKYKPCSDQTPLTTVAFSEASQRYVLQINENVINSYSKSGVIDCCYQVIERNATGRKADYRISLSECISFKKSTKLAQHIDNILVKCHTIQKQVYINGHAMMPERTELRKRLNNWRQIDKKYKRQRPPSVLMIGIDSISRNHLIRAMPKTAQYLYDNNWFEMSGYNKIDDNTFPNLMAVLTGRNKSNAYSKCPPWELNGLDNCNFIWRTFRDHGYVTAYGEDDTIMNTFNYGKLGFQRPPVDYYIRPFLLAAEKHLEIKIKSRLIYCLGYQHSADFIYEYAIELARRYNNDPFFGLFWTNTFSHNAISDSSGMDDKIVEYLKRFAALDIIDNTIKIFFSDHGSRFGPTRATFSGHFEERLPIMFIWLPQQLKHRHPEFVNALNVNKNRLTNPYDLHMTLKHILEMNGRVENSSLLLPAENCPHCQTLFKPVPFSRSCGDIAIEDHWCTCIAYQSVNKNSKIIHNLANAAVSYINNYVAEYRNGSISHLCLPLHLSDVDSAYRAHPIIGKFNLKNSIGNNTNRNSSNGSVDIYRLIFRTKPNNGMYEATIRYGTSSEAGVEPIIEITGEISRINSYSSDTDCVGDIGAKKYCSCRKK